MSTVSTKPKSVEVFTHHVSAGPRSYFLNVKRAPRGELFVTISELTAKENTWTTSKVLIPADHMKEFYQGLCEAIKAMRQADAQFPKAVLDKKPVAAKPRRQPNTQPPVEVRPEPANSSVARQATGRPSQGANRRALTSGVR